MQIKMSDAVGALLQGKMIAPNQAYKCFCCSKDLGEEDLVLYGLYSVCKACDESMMSQLEVLNGELENSKCS